MNPTVKNILLLIAFVFVVFSPCLKADFINLDDDGHILKNAALQDLSPSSIKQIFTQTLNKTYIPLTVLTFAVEKHFFAFDPFVFHLDNLLLYAADSVLVLLLAMRIGLSVEAGFLAALVFAIHPMRVENVAWAVERKDVLYAFFYLLALHQYWSYLKTLSMKYYLAALLFGFLSMLAKPMAVSLPLILLLFDWYDGRGYSKRVVVEKLPVFLYVTGIAWISYALNMRNLLGNIFPEGVLIWIWSLVFYLWKFLFPFKVYPYYILPHPVSILHWPYLLSVILLGALIVLLVRFRRHKLFVFAFFYFFCSIFFLLRFDHKDFSVVSDRFMFLPSLGICFLLGSWLERCVKTKWGAIIFYLVLVLMAVKTNLQCRIWHDSLSFWNEIIREYPDYYIAYNNRGKFFHEHGRDDLALIDCTKAIALDPKAGKVYKNLAILEEARKNYKQALQDALDARKFGASVTDTYLKNLQDEIAR